MSRRSGQKGQVVKKGRVWHVRFYVDAPGQETRQRKSVLIGPCVGPNKLTKAEAQRKGAEVINSLGVNTEEHLQRATNPQTFKERVEWCRDNRTAWTEGKPSSVLSMESQLTKHILPRLGDLPLHMVDETVMQEFISHLKRTTFEMRKPNRDLIKTYRLSHKTVLNIVGVVKLVLGKKVWATWELDLGHKPQQEARYFTQDELQHIINKADGQYRVLFALLAGTGMRIGEAAGLHVEDVDVENCRITIKRAVWNGVEQSPKTTNALRVIDIHPDLAEMMKNHLAGKVGLVFKSKTGSPISGNNILKRVLHPLLAELEIPKAGLHAFRHSRVTILRKENTPAHLQTQWVGHSSLQTTNGYDHTAQEVEYRREMASKVGLGFAVVGPNGPN
jgi:integrase